MSFGQLIIFDEFTLELILSEGEVSKRHVGDYIAFWKPRKTVLFKVLLNQMNSFSYFFLAQQRLQSTKLKPVIAILNATKVSSLAFESMAALVNHWTYAVFESREVALAWLSSYEV